MIASRPTLTWDGIAKWAFDLAVWVNNRRAYEPFWKEVSGTVTLEDSWNFVLCDTSGGACTPTLPTGMPKGWSVIVQDNGSAGSNNITITRGGSDTINGANTLAISANYGRKVLFSDGAGKWYAA